MALPLDSNCLKNFPGELSEELSRRTQQNSLPKREPAAPNCVIVALIAAHCVLYATDSVLNFARDLVALTFGFELGVARYLANSFLARSDSSCACSSVNSVRSV